MSDVSGRRATFVVEDEVSCPGVPNVGPTAESFAADGSGTDYWGALRDSKRARVIMATPRAGEIDSPTDSSSVPLAT